jgi:DNA-binding MarR family transcriptional regulator
MRDYVEVEPMEQDVADKAIAEQALRLISAWEEISRIGPRMKVVLPEGLIRLKERMRELHPEGGPKRHLDHDLFHRISTTLARQEHPMTMGELSESLEVPANTATRMVDWLVTYGYAQRQQDQVDRRMVRVSLTPKGLEVHQALSDFTLRHAMDLLKQFTPEERETLIALLRKLARMLNEEEGQGS